MLCCSELIDRGWFVFANRPERRCSGCGDREEFGRGRGPTSFGARWWVFQGGSGPAGLLRFPFRKNLSAAASGYVGSCIGGSRRRRWL